MKNVELLMLPADEPSLANKDNPGIFGSYFGHMSICKRQL
jgi:hypothetical protein